MQPATLIAAALLRRLRRTRGTTVVAASLAGISFYNAPGSVPSGKVDRDDIDTLVVHYTSGLLRRKFALVLRVHGRRKITLIEATDEPALQNAATELKRAMGIHRDEPIETAGEASRSIG